MEIVEWIIWGISVLIAFSFIYGIRTYARRGQNFQKGTAVITLFLLLASIVFLLVDWSKLNLIWVVPLVFIIVFKLFNGIVHIPILTPVVMFITKMFVSIIIVGIKPMNTDNKNLEKNNI